MATADKLNQALQSRIETKDAINESGVVEITDEPFRAYPDIIREMIKKFKQSVPYTTKTGNPITLNAYPLSFRSSKVYGHSEQIQSTGKNIINVPNGEETINNYYYTNHATNKIITEDMVGKKYSFSFDIDIKSISSTDITASSVIGIGSSATSIETVLGTVSYPNISVGHFSVKIEGITINESMIGKYIAVRFYGMNKPTSVTYDYSNVMLEQGEKATNYEPFTNGQPTPTPEYPSEIKNVEGIENAIIDLYANSSTFITWDFDASKIASSIIFSGIINKTVSNAFVYIQTSSGNINTGKINIVENQKFEYIITLTNEQIEQIKTSTFKPRIQLYGGGDYSNVEYSKIMLGNSSSYVPYGNKYLPINIKGSQLFNKNGDFNYGNSNHRTSLQEDGTILTTSNIYANRSSGQLIENLKSNTNYTLSGILVSANGTSSNNVCIQVLTPTPSSEIKTEYINRTVTKPYNFAYNFNTGDNTSVWISLNGFDTTGTNNLETVFDNIMLVEGTQATEYEPYHGSNNYCVPLKKKNLFDGELESGYINVDTGLNASSGNNLRTKNYIPIKPDKDYILSTNVSKDRYALFYDKNKTYLSYIQVANLSLRGTFKSPNNAYYVRWYDVLNNDLNTKFVLYEGLGVDDYIELCKINNVKDEYNILTGKIIKRIGKVVLDGSEGWSKSGNVGICEYRFVLQINDMKNGSTVYCNYFKQGNYTTETSFIYVAPTINYIWLSSIDLQDLTLDGFKQWLKQKYDEGNPVIIEYELAEPYEIEVEPIEITPFEGTNIIKISDKYDLIDDAEITYYTTWENIANN